MSNGMASGVPPADGWAGGAAAGAGVGVCARVGELINATAHAATVVKTISRILSSQLKSGFIEAPPCSNPCPDCIFRLLASAARSRPRRHPYSTLIPASLIILRRRASLALNASMELVPERARHDRMALVETWLLARPRLHRGPRSQTLAEMKSERKTQSVFGKISQHILR
jgi:hypothetical protein